MSTRPTPARSRGRRATPKQTGLPRGVLIALLIGLVVVVAIGAAVLLSGQSNSASNGPIEGLQTFPNLARDHVNGPLSYPQVPPVGGAHNPVWMNCGIYDQPIPNENAVHSLEHGAVWITYQPDLPAASIEQLRALVRGHTSVLLSPYPGLPSSVVASAWGLQIRADSSSDPRLAKFVALYERGPQTPEPGASCSGAKGVPLVK